MKWIISAVLLAALAEATIEPPSEDPFYSAPSNLSSYSLGEIIRSRVSPGTVQGLTDVKTSYELLYRTNDALDNPEATVTLVVVPDNADFSKLLSYQVYEDSAWSSCAPSYTWLESGADDSVQTLLKSDWVVCVPDYEGPDSAFTAGIQAGHAVLDGVRACLNSGSVTGIESDARVLLSGYSGGALASGWAAQLQPSYAPDLSIAGAAFGGFPVNITATALITNGGEYAGLIPAGILGLGAAYPDFNKTVADNLVESTASEFYKADGQCLDSNILTYFGQNIFNYFTDGEEVLYLPVIQDVLNENTLGASAPKIPLYVFQGIDDHVAPVVNVDETITDYCNENAPSIEYIKYPGESHTGTFAAGWDAAEEWLEKIMSGSAPISGCLTSTTTGVSGSVSSATSSIASNATSAISATSTISTASMVTNTTIAATSASTKASVAPVTTSSEEAAGAVTTHMTVTDTVPCSTESGSMTNSAAGSVTTHITVTDTVPCSTESGSMTNSAAVTVASSASSSTPVVVSNGSNKVTISLVAGGFALLSILF